MAEPSFKGDILDSDVRNEENFAHLVDKSSNDIVVLNAIKEYQDGKIIAINDISFHVSTGECFCILGDFGSGKSSLIKVLATVEDLTSGNAYIDGLNISKDYDGRQANVVYCPFEIYLFEEFTVYDHLRIFLGIYGFPKKDMLDFVQNFTELIGLSQYLNKKVGSLREGQKRKLCLSLLLMNCPKVLLLDEPTHSIDLIERRQIWSLIHLINQTNKTVIIATNSAAECEALCSRLAVMVEGKFSCIGSVQRLKNKFSIGLILNIKMAVTKKTSQFYSASCMENESFTTEESEESVKVGRDDINKLILFWKDYFPNIQVR